MKKVLSLLLTFVLIMGLVPGVARAQTTVIRDIEIESHNFAIGYGLMNDWYEFKTVKGAPAYIAFNSNDCYWQRLDENGAWKRVYSDEAFQAGTYRYVALLALDEKDRESYSLGDSIRITINGEVMVEGFNPGSQIKNRYVITTKEIQIEKPAQQYSLHFDANGGSGSMLPYTQVAGGVQVPEICKFTPPLGYEFAGWKVDPKDKKFVVNTLWVDRDVTLYAIWREIHSVTLGGVCIGSGEYLAQGATETTTKKPDDHYAAFTYSKGNYILTLHNYSYTGSGYCFFDQRYHREAIVYANVPNGYRLFVQFEGENSLVYNGTMNNSCSIYNQGHGISYMKLSGQEDAVLNLEGANEGISIYTSFYMDSGTVNINATSFGISQCQQTTHISGGKLKIVTQGVGMYIACREESVFENCEVLLISTGDKNGDCALEVNTYGEILNLHFDSNLLVTAATDAGGTQKVDYSRDELENYRYLHLQMPPTIDVVEVCQPTAGVTPTKTYSLDSDVKIRVTGVKWLDANGSEVTQPFVAGETYTFRLQYLLQDYLSQIPTATVNGCEATNSIHPVDKIGVIQCDFVCPEYYFQMRLKPFYVGHDKMSYMIRSINSNTTFTIEDIGWKNSEPAFQPGETDTVSITVTTETEASQCSFLVNGVTPKITYRSENEVVLQYSVTMPTVQVFLTEDSNPIPGGTVKVDLERFAQQSEEFTEAYFENRIQVNWYAQEMLVGLVGSDVSYTIPDPCSAKELYAVVTVDGVSYSHEPIRFNLAVAYGDVNGDGKVDATDALLVLQSAVDKVTLTQEQKLAAEVDGQEGINAKDALEILKYAVQKINEFPIERK